MFVKKSSGPRTATLPDGRILTMADLPPSDTRWVASRKEVVVLAIRHGLITRDEALRRYGLSDEELDAWEQAVAKHGRKALKVTSLQRFRQPKVD
ncbi:CtrA inhibitor SciP [Paracoccus sp. NSM]|uniref:CtrA inhibitor SciP n=1 Tax=Paracoccus sp. NSM TaxID=3457784 RepID=UPI0040350814